MIGPVTTSDELGILAGFGEAAGGAATGGAGLDAGADAAFVVDGASGLSSPQPTDSVNAPSINAMNTLFIFDRLDMLDILTNPSNPTASTPSKCTGAAAEHIPRDRCRF